MTRTDQLICVRCLSLGPGKTHLAGSAAITTVLIIAGFVAVGFALDATTGAVGIAELLILAGVCLSPAVIYQFQRGARRYATCAACGSKDVLPANSPRGRQLQASAEERQ